MSVHTLPSLHRGYRHLLPESHTNEPPPDPAYHRPHRKDLMENIFHKPRQDFHLNPVAAAMDLPIFGDTHIQAVRQPARLPQQFIAHLQDLDPLEKEFKSADQIAKEFERWMQDRVLEMRFDEKVLNEYGVRLGLSREKVFRQPEDLHPPSQSQQPPFDTPDLLLHKSEWLTHIMQNRTARGKRSFEDIPSTYLKSFSTSSQSPTDSTHPTKTLRMLLKASDTYSTRNVPYMLEVWQRVEGINVEAAMARYAREEAAQKAESRSKVREFTERVSSAGGGGSRPSSSLSVRKGGSWRPGTGGVR
ncbi:hypothetical protein HK097_010986, partial [Rhizophlyctis rosea]